MTDNPMSATSGQTAARYVGAPGTVVEAYRYTGTRASAQLIADAFDLAVEAAGDQLSAWFTVAPRWDVASGAVADGDRRQLGVAANCWVWADRTVGVIGVDWDDYLRARTTPTGHAALFRWAPLVGTVADQDALADSWNAGFTAGLSYAQLQTEVSPMVADPPRNPHRDTDWDF